MNKTQVRLNTVLSCLVMASIMSGVISGFKMGFSTDWPPVWLQSFTLSFPIALVLGFTVLPLVKKFSIWVGKPRTKTPLELKDVNTAPLNTLSVGAPTICCAIQSTEE
ncbi:DUF2798 domain-containing protein [Vibrio sp. ZSDE26]|uniref:DUF2798 domain-containing protein n=1 Tax=Vibrio amylolyticus TaxID=2847292 RepID=A0A9X1XJR0_9VIBR|nr:DUF2798 domain-containing protein [Vibrio amylolyticus]MCK6264164.1 DUF2798 domain-containing protein [Vibrio amylolyticus]